MPNRKELLTGPIEPSEYGEYYGRYVSKSNGEYILNQFSSNSYAMINVLKSVSEKKASYRYEPGKWSIKEVIGHITDTERVMSYRALSFARGETQPLPGYNHEDYVKFADFEDQALRDLINQYRSVRQASETLFQSFSAEMLMRKGTASNNEFTVRALGFIIVGHEKHHLEILKERYL